MRRATAVIDSLDRRIAYQDSVIAVQDSMLVINQERYGAIIALQDEHIARLRAIVQDAAASSPSFLGRVTDMLIGYGVRAALEKD